jgi:hypothetical protein
MDDLKKTLLAIAKGFAIGSCVMYWGLMFSGAKIHLPEPIPAPVEYHDPVFEAYERTAAEYGSMTVELTAWQPNTITVEAGENTEWILLASGSAIILKQVAKEASE